MSVYNGQDYIRRAVDSILQQTFADFELIVIDDGSTDDTWLILSEAAANDRRLRLLRNDRNLGQTASMNKLWPLMRGDYVNRHDADDISLPDRYAQQVAFLEANPAIGLVSCLVEVIDQTGQVLDRDPYASPLDNDSIQAILLDHNCLCQGSVMFRRNCLELVGSYDENLKWTEDYDLWLRLVEVTQVAKLPGRFYQYRHHPASISHTHRAEQDFHQAQTLEKTLRRRFGAIPSQYLDHILKNYIAGVESACLTNNRDLARQSLAQALRLCPTYFAGPEGYLPIKPDWVIPDLLEEVFLDLPSSRDFRSLRAKMLGRWHMHSVFSAVAENRPDLINLHLWAGLRQDPSWLMNRGVLSLVTKSILNSVRMTAGMNDRKDKLS